MKNMFSHAATESQESRKTSWAAAVTLLAAAAGSGLSYAGGETIGYSAPFLFAQFEVILPWGTPRADAAAADALDLIDRLESQLTVYRPTSEVSRLNRTAGLAPMPVEPRLFDLLQMAERISRGGSGYGPAANAVSMAAVSYGR